MAIYKNVVKHIGFNMITTGGLAFTNGTVTVKCYTGKDTTVSMGTCGSSPVRSTVKGAVTNSYRLRLSATEMNGDLVRVYCTATGCLPWSQFFYTEANFSPTVSNRIDMAISAVATTAWHSVNSRTITGGIVNTATNISNAVTINGGSLGTVAYVNYVHTAGVVGTVTNAVTTTESLGAIAYRYNVTVSGDPDTPISDVDVWVCTDANGTNVVGNGRTNSFGNVTFHLDAGTYYIWRQKAGYNFTNPITKVVSAS
jgi:hypothetical protein